jgi:DNA-binding beta-propeller fold protein YncE
MGRGAREGEAVIEGTWRQRALVLLGLLLAALLLGSAPALALGQRGHAFSFAFGSQGKEPGQFEHPSAIAVDDWNGDVYVADRNDNRVEKFEPEFSKGQLVGERQVGESLKVPSPVSIAVDNCTLESKPGEAKPCTGDPSLGDVYVVGANGEKEAAEPEPEEDRVYKFNSEGEQISKLGKFKHGSEEDEFEEQNEVAVDSVGALFVYQESEDAIDRFSDAIKNEGEEQVLSSLTEESRPGFAVDSYGDFYVGVDFDGEGSELEEQIAAEWESTTGEELAVVAKLAGASGAVLDPSIDFEDSTAVAVNPSDAASDGVAEHNDVYVDNMAIVAGEHVTTVAAFGPNGEPIQRFGAPGLKQGDGIAVDSQTGAVYVTDSQADDVDVFDLEPPGPPTVGDLAARTSPSTPNPTALSAKVNPTGAATHYDFEYGAGSCSAVPSECTTIPKGEAYVGDGFGEDEVSQELPPSLPTGVYHYRVVAKNEFGTVRSAEQTFTILASASGLPDGRAWELVSPPNKAGAEPQGMTEKGGVIQAAANGDAITYIADGPMPAEAEPEGSRSPEVTQIISTRSSSGWFTQDIAPPNSTGSGLGVGTAPEYQLFSPDLALALVEPFIGAAHSGGLADPPLSPPLSAKEAGHQEKTIYLRDDAPLEAEANEGETEEERAQNQANYKEAKENGELMKNPGYVALVTEMNRPGGEAFGGGEGVRSEGLEFEGANADLNHGVIGSYRAASGLYEWEPDSSLQPVSVLPESEGGKRVDASEASLGSFEARDVRNAISKTGALVVWTADGHLYVRDTETQETLKLDAVQPGASGEGEVHAVFQTASTEGSKVFFTDTQRLTADSEAGDGIEASDLYVAELSGGSAPGSPLSLTLKDLTPEGTHGESAAVLVSGLAGGGVVGASEDGSRVYFVANGVLSDSANAEGEKAVRGECPTGAEQAPGATCNLYERQRVGTEWTPTRLVAVLSAEDSPDWGGVSHEGDLGYQTSQVSPDGEYAAFMSDRSLTGYDNEDVSPEAEGARDEEVFLYDARSGGVVCASCNPIGARPKGVLDGRANYEGGEGLLVDRQGIWGPRANPYEEVWLAASVPGWTPLDPEHALYQSRYLSDSGRLFFNSPDQLVPATEGEKDSKEKVYEYEPNEVGSCHSGGGCVALLSAANAEHESAFVDASANGNNVFFLTAERLVQQDVDESYDVYDARVCEPASPCLTAPLGGGVPCASEAECRPGASGSSSSYSAPASTTSSGEGNLVAKQQVLPEKVSKTPTKPPKPLTRAQKLANALKACKKDRKKSRRDACERQARKQFGPKRSKARKSSTRERGR